MSPVHLIGQAVPIKSDTRVSSFGELRLRRLAYSYTGASRHERDSHLVRMFITLFSRNFSVSFVSTMYEFCLVTRYPNFCIIMRQPDGSEVEHTELRESDTEQAKVG